MTYFARNGGVAPYTANDGTKYLLMQSFDVQTQSVSQTLTRLNNAAFYDLRYAWALPASDLVNFGFCSLSVLFDDDIVDVIPLVAEVQSYQPQSVIVNPSTDTAQLRFELDCSTAFGGNADLILDSVSLTIISGLCDG